MQLDIFEHSRDVMLKNDVVGALERRDATGARTNRAALFREYPEFVCLADLDTMIDALEKPAPRVQTHQELAPGSGWQTRLSQQRFGYWETARGTGGSPIHGKTWLPVRRRCRFTQTHHTIMLPRFGCVLGIGHARRPPSRPLNPGAGNQYR